MVQPFTRQILLRAAIVTAHDRSPYIFHLVDLTDHGIAHARI